MPTSHSPLLLHVQRGIPAPVPATDADLPESDRLRAALFWNYSFELYMYDPGPGFSIRIRLGADSPDAATAVEYRSLDVAISSEGDQQTLRLTPGSGGTAVTSFELIPLDSEGIAVAFYRLDEGSDLATLSYQSETPSQRFRIDLCALNVARVAELRTCALAPDTEPNCFAHDFQIEIDRAEVFHLDRLSGTTELIRGIASQLRALWDIVLNDVTECRLGVQVQYRVAGALPITTPVLLLPPAVYAASSVDELSNKLADAISQWQQALDPAPGEYLLDLSLSPANLSTPAPALRLRNLVLAAD